MKRPSIRARLVLSASLLTSTILIISGCLLYLSIRSSLYSQLDRILEDAASVVMIEVEVKNSQVHHEWREALESDAYRKANTMIQVWDLKSGDTVRAPALGPNDLPKKFGELNERVFFDLTLPDGRRGRAVGILIHPLLEHPEQDRDFIPSEHPQVFVWAESTENLQNILNKSRLVFIVGGLFIIALLWVTIWWVTGRSLRPMEIVSQTVLSRVGNETSSPIPIPDQLPSEVAGMAETFNTLLSRIDQSREKDRDFFLNVAHEIRTPLSGVHAILEQALRKPRQNEDYQDRISNALKGSHDLQQLIHSLMKFGRINSQVEQPKIQTVSLGDLLDPVWNTLQPQAESRKLQLNAATIDKDSLLNTDNDLAKIVLSNVLGNAVTYSSPASEILVTYKNNTHSHEVEIENSIDDETIDDDELTRFFDPFFRRDKVRSRSEGHAGIGLSFARDIMVILGGSIKVSQNHPYKIAFSICFPAQTNQS
ncbi:ATP-binding protein [Akkermansiaceae bacterium]|nr:ATP-binding protein [Akkermansiaceae bacterium]MDB4537313.1 ATP-binding protein [Akkermansiaceae bacterium]